MFNSTHTLVGLAAARTGLDEWAPRATWTAIIASNLPDIDIVTQLAGTTSYLDHHRGITHTLAGVPVLSLLLATIMSVGRWSAWRSYFFVALIVMSTHPLLDWANTYGIRPFLPFKATWYYGDTLFIFDPWLDLLLLIPIVLSYGLPTMKKPIAAAALALAVLYVGSMIGLRDIAGAEFERAIESRPGVVQFAVGPDFFNPFRWTGFLETTRDVASYRIDLPTGRIEEENRLAALEPSTVTEAAESTYTGKVFRRFARFPVTQVHEEPWGYRVLLIDFRFLRPGQHTALSAEISLDKDLQIIRQSMSFVAPID